MFKMRITCLLVLVLATSAEAEGAWVQWARAHIMWEKHGPLPSRFRQGEEINGLMPDPWIIRAYPTYKACQAEVDKVPPGGSWIAEGRMGAKPIWIGYDSV